MRSIKEIKLALQSVRRSQKRIDARIGQLMSDRVTNEELEAMFIEELQQAEAARDA